MQGAPIFLYTDFGSSDIYVGQVKSVLHDAAPASAVIDLLNDVPSFDIAGAAHLLSALARQLPEGAITIAVVDPGVGSARDAIAVEADARWYVGPDNGLMSVVMARARASRCFSLRGMPEPQSASFHGRDLFAPAAAAIARLPGPSFLTPKRKLDVQLPAEDLAQIIYIDHYGNTMTGIRAGAVMRTMHVSVGTQLVGHARVFAEAPPWQCFWYENSIGLLEIAANRASAAAILDLKVGQFVGFGLPR
jgi:S-adenosyl-L-methionine hydrolase (adenosine-forming)